MSTMEPTASPAGTSPPFHGEPIAVGTAFGSYRIGGTIGAGAMGMVYRAEHCRLGKQVALKLMAPALRASQEARQRFLLEAKITAAIKHRHVVEIIDLGECGGDPYIVMELLEGEDLERYLQTRVRLPPHEALSLLLPIVAALASAHDAGVVHRDLKPSNIFLHHEPDGSLVPKLLDFGISKHAPGLPHEDFQRTSGNQLLGSPQYLPPEAVNGCRDLSPRSDQYSLGVVLYETVTGRAPIQRKTLLELLTAISNAEFAPPSHGLPELSGPMENAILQCMQRDPAARFAHVRELGRALLELADGRTRLLWSQAFDPACKADAASLVCISGAATGSSGDGAARTSGRGLLSVAALSLGVLAAGSGALVAVAPPLPQVDRSFRTVRDERSLRAARPPTLSAGSPMPEAVIHFALSTEGLSVSDPSRPTPLEVVTTAADEGHAARDPKRAARAKRGTRSPQRPPRLAGAARIPQQGAPSGAAAGDPISPHEIDAELDDPAQGLRGLPPSTPGVSTLGPVGANESRFFD